MVRRSFGREFKLEAVRLVSERGITVAQAARDLDLHEKIFCGADRCGHSNPEVRLRPQPQSAPTHAVGGQRLCKLPLQSAQAIIGAFWLVMFTLFSDNSWPQISSFR